MIQTLKMNANLLVNRRSITSKRPLRLTCTAMFCAALWISYVQAHGTELRTIAILDLIFWMISTNCLPQPSNTSDCVLSATS